MAVHAVIYSVAHTGYYLLNGNKQENAHEQNTKDSVNRTVLVDRYL